MNFFLGLFVAASFVFVFYFFRKKGFKELADEILEKAITDAQLKKKTAEILIKEREILFEKQLEEKLLLWKKEISKKEERFDGKEIRLEEKEAFLQRKSSEIEKTAIRLEEKEKKLQSISEHLKEKEAQITNQLETLTSLNVLEARKLIFDQASKEIEAEIELYEKQRWSEAAKNAEEESKKLLATSICRLAIAAASKEAETVVLLPREDIKSRIVGREGRNIRFFEQLTGVNVALDETPQAVVLSSFDAKRREIAKIALEELIKDGRIHPSRIEEKVEEAKVTIIKRASQEGEKALLETGVLPLHPEILKVLGSLSFRTTQGQNLLAHSIEVSKIAGMLAAELGQNVQLAKRIGLLHDIGKGLSEFDGESHAKAGMEFALKYQESPEVAMGIGAHHDESPHLTIESSLCCAANLLSRYRQDTRSENIELILNRVLKLETLCNFFPEVQQAFALHGGREIRVIVEADKIPEAQLPKFAKKIAEQIEDDLSYTGKIKVTVIREKKHTEYAT